MSHIEILDSGYVDREDSAFATIVVLDDGDLVCGFSRGGGHYARGDTHCARSADNGQTWTYQGVVLARETNSAQNQSPAIEPHPGGGDSGLRSAGYQTVYAGRFDHDL